MVRKYSFNRIGIYSSHSNKKKEQVVNQCLEVLKHLGISAVVSNNFKRNPAIERKRLVSDATITKTCDLIIAIGGDGTMLSSSRKFGSKGIPVLGVNLGKLGFLSDLGLEDLTQNLNEIVKGDFLVDKRFFIEASVNKSKKVQIAMNEVVLHSGAIAQMMEYELYIDNKFVYQQKADGVILSSPTGTTAYSLSGGGPIVHPDVPTMVILPIFPHSLSTSSLVVSSSSKIQIKIIDCKNKAKLSFDSHDSITLNKGDVIDIKESKTKYSLIHPRGHDFFSACRNKLGWSSRIV
jgi:NAD+ kinase